MNAACLPSFAVEAPAYAALQREMHDPRKARPEGSQFRRTGWIAQLVHALCSIAAARSERTGCRRRRSGDALLRQHPEWMERDGNCPVGHTLQSVDMKVRDYDRRFARLLGLFLTLERANAH